MRKVVRWRGVGAGWNDHVMREGGSSERPATFFDDALDFRAWLEANHERATELWMGLQKKHVEPRGLQWAEAVREDEAESALRERAEGLELRDGEPQPEGAS